MHFTTAIVRKPGIDSGAGLTTAALGAPDMEKMLQQHAAYASALRDLGLHVVALPALAGYPDAYFVEDVAVVTPEVAVVTNPGAASRSGEAAHIVPTLTQFRPIRHITTPGTLDGGDVMVIDRYCYVGLSARTNAAGAAQLAAILAEHGYTTHTIPVGDGLHLKSSVNFIGRNTLLLSAAFANHPALAPYQHIVVDEAEEYAANTLLVNDHLLMPSGYPHTLAQLTAAEFAITLLDTSEIRKMDGGLSCLSLRL